MDTLSINEKHFLNLLSGKTLTELSKEMNLSKSAITNRINRLEKKGFIYKKWDKKERRYFKNNIPSQVCPCCGKVI